MAPTDPQTACFELGIKFGSLYHQFAGTPVSLASADSLARAMEEAIGNQPYCSAVSVDIRRDVLAGDLAHGYTELTGKYLDVEIAVDYEGVRARADIEMADGYPRMRLVAVEA